MFLCYDVLFFLVFIQCFTSKINVENVCLRPETAGVEGEKINIKFKLVL